ncbi:hypothetical protein MRX96_030864 [Rhipicephalus microplus]
MIRKELSGAQQRKEQMSQNNGQTKGKKARRKETWQQAALADTIPNRRWCAGASAAEIRYRVEDDQPVLRLAAAQLVVSTPPFFGPFYPGRAEEEAIPRFPSFVSKGTRPRGCSEVNFYIWSSKPCLFFPSSPLLQ